MCAPLHALQGEVAIWDAKVVVVLGSLDRFEMTTGETSVFPRRPDIPATIPPGQGASHRMLTRHKHRIQGNEAAPGPELDPSQIDQGIGSWIIEMVENSDGDGYIKTTAENRRVGHRSKRELTQMTEPSAGGFDVRRIRIEPDILLFGQEFNNFPRATP